MAVRTSNTLKKVVKNVNDDVAYEIYRQAEF
jgi:hypothetical protein